MAGYQQKPGDIAVFMERDKRNDRAPDWKGTLVIPDNVKPGDKLEVALWAKGSAGTMLAGAVQIPRQRDQQTDDFRGNPGGGGSSPMAGGERDGSRGGDGFEDSEIPFVTSAGIR